jgi:hypothetical protein
MRERHTTVRKAFFLKVAFVEGMNKFKSVNGRKALNPQNL